MGKYKSFIKIIISIAAGVFLCGIWLQMIHLPTVISHFYHLQKKMLLPSLSFYLLAYFFRSQRLKYLLAPKLVLSSLRNFWYVLTGNYLNYLIPLRAGEVAKCLIYKKKHQLSIAESLPIIFLDKFCDTIIIFGVLILLPLTPIIFSPYLNWLIILIILVFCFGLLIIVLATVKKEQTVNFIQKLFFFIPLQYNKQLIKSVTLFTEGLTILSTQKKIISYALFYTFLATVSDSLFFFLMMQGFHVDISFRQVMFGYTLIFLSYILPHPPLHIGSNELVMVIIFTLGMGYEENLISAVMSLSHLLTGLVILLTGTIGLLYTGIEINDIKKIFAKP